MPAHGNIDNDATLTELSGYYLDNIVKGNYALSSYQSYKVRMDKYVLPEIGTRQVKDLKKLDIQNLIFELNNEAFSISANTIRLVHHILHRILDFAVDIEIADRNAADRVVLPKQEKYQPVIYSKLEVRNLVEVAKGNILYIPIMIAITAGLRRSETLALRWGDVNFQNSTIMVRSAIAGRSLHSTKTKNSLRCLQVSDSLMLTLKDHKEAQIQLLSNHGCSQSNHTFLVCKPDGNPYSPSYISKRFSELLKANNLPVIRFHDLRHAYATHAHNSGMPVKHLSKSLGHSSAAATLDNYVHIDDRYSVFLEG